MKISNITCPSCQASYEVAESISVKGRPGCAQCTVCSGMDLSGVNKNAYQQR